MSEPTTAKATGPAANNGRLKDLSNEAENIKAGEAAMKDAEAMGISQTATKKVAVKKKTEKDDAITRNGAQQMETWMATFSVNSEETMEKMRNYAAEAMSSFESSQASLVGAATETQRRMLAYAQSVMEERMELLKAMAEVKTPADMMKLQSEFAAQSIKSFAEQMNDIRAMWTDATKESLAPFTQAFEKLGKWSA